MLCAACRDAAQRAGIDKTVQPHLLRHSFATRLLEGGADIATVQRLLGNSNVKHTCVYLHLSERHIRAAGSPLDKLDVSSPNQVKRSRKLHKK
jgi:site-specific recombinase XerD